MDQPGGLLDANRRVILAVRSLGDIVKHNGYVIPLLILAWAQGVAADDRIDARLIGAWQTDKLLSQLGEIMYSREFKSDGNCTSIVRFLQMDQSTSREGTCSTNGNILTVVRGSEKSEEKYWFEENTLIIQENDGEIYRLKQKPATGPNKRLDGSATLKPK